VPFNGPEAPAALCEQFIEAAHEFDAGNYSEGRSFLDYEPSLRSRWPKSLEGGAEARKPAETEGLDDLAWADFQEQDMSLYNVGGWVTLVDDPLASNGRAVRMTTDHLQWATQCQTLTEMAALGPWHCYAVVRCESKVEEGNAFTLGLYDSAQRRDVFVQVITIPQAMGREALTEGPVRSQPKEPGGYVTYDLGVQQLQPGMYFWLAPMANPDQMEAIYTDRFFFTKP
jgi:hypothetical protein